MWKKIISKILNIFKRKNKKIVVEKTTTKTSFFRKWKSLKAKDRDKIRETILKDKEVEKEIKEIKEKKIKKILIKDLNNIPKSTQDKQILKEFEDIVINEEKPMEQTMESYKISDSAWISRVIYFPKEKKVAIFIENQNGVKKWYNFYNVPKTKFLMLVELRGTFMWDYFGKHYSLNPSHWIRKRK